MTGFEAVGVAGELAKAVTRKAFVTWLQHGTERTTRTSDLTDLIATSFTDRFHRRKFERQVQDVADAVERRLEPLCQVEFAGLDAGEKAAASDVAIRTLQGADLSDEGLFAADANPAKLTRTVRANLPVAARGAALSAAAIEYCDLLLAECVEDYVRIVTGVSAFLPRASQEVLSRLSEISLTVGQIFERLPPRGIARTQDDLDGVFLSEYTTLLSQTLDELELFGVDVSSYRPRTNLSVAYISLSVSAVDDARPQLGQQGVEPARQPRDLTRLPSQACDRERGEEEGEEGGGAAGSSAGMRVEAALGGSSRILIRGEAGSGKSTLLRWLAVTSARGGFTGDLAAWNGSVPFLIKLRSYGDGKLPHLHEFLDRAASAIAGHMPDAWVDRQFQTGRALLLVDGVDELAASQRAGVRDWLSMLVSAYPSSRVVVTSRPAAAANDWLVSAGFSAATLRAMTPDDIRAFIDQWHRAVYTAGSLPPHAKSLPSFEAALVARLEGSPHLRALATSPLLCAMLCALNLDRNTHLPRNRMGIYEAALKLLLQRRDAERDIPSSQALALEDDDKLDLLRDLAYRLALYSRSELSKRDALRWVATRLVGTPHAHVGPAVVLEHLLQRSGVIREPAVGRIDFVHRTFQEYLAAAEFIRLDHVLYLQDKAHLDLWRDTVVMAAGHANEPQLTELLLGLLDRAQAGGRHARRLRLMVVACLETVRRLPTEEDIPGRVEQCVEQLVPPRSMNEVRSLASGGEQVLARLPADLTNLSPASAAATVATVLLSGGPEALGLLKTYASGERRREVLTQLLLGWEYFDADVYAREVLAESPLYNGRLDIEQTRQLRYVHHLRELRHLTVRLDAKDLPDLTNESYVKGLSVSGTGVCNVTTIANCAALESLEVLAPLLGEVEGLSRLARLRFLSIPTIGLTDFEFLEALRRLVRLRVSSNEVRDFSHLARVPGLRTLLLNGGQHLTSIADLGDKPELRALAVNESAGLRTIEGIVSSMPALERLSLHRVPPGLSYRPLEAHASLQRLELFSCADVDLTQVTTSRNLRVLRLIGCLRMHNLDSLTRVRWSVLGLHGLDEQLDLSFLRGIRAFQVTVDSERAQEARSLVHEHTQVLGVSGYKPAYDPPPWWNYPVPIP